MILAAPQTLRLVLLLAGISRPLSSKGDMFRAHVRRTAQGGHARTFMPVWRCLGSRLVEEGQREFSRDSTLKFLLAHLRER